MIDEHGSERDVMKRPKNEGSKTSLPGIVRVVASPSQKGALTVLPATWNRQTKRSEGEGESAMLLVWDHGPVDGCWEEFDVMRERVEQQWAEAPPVYDVISAQLKGRAEKWVAEFGAREEARRSGVGAQQQQQDGDKSIVNGVEQPGSGAR